MDLGFIKADHEIVWANDNDVDSIKTYKNYFCEKLGLDENHVMLGDIKDVRTDDIPDGDVVIGGFPCQGFSIANPYRHTEDSRNELYLELLRIIKGKKPKYFIAENVQGITSIGGYETSEDQKHKEGKVLKMILEDFRKAGYYVKWKVLNAADFGVPQLRKRIIILGTRHGVYPDLLHPEPTHNQYPERSDLPTWTTLRSAIGNLPDPNSSHVLKNHIGTSHQVKINGFIGNRATQWDKPSPTIVGRGGGTGGPVIIPHPNLERRLTVRETARIQCFPDNFEFYGSISSCYRQIGNAVPWPLAYHVARMLPTIVTTETANNQKLPSARTQLIA